MLRTESRPAPLPPRDGQPTPAGARPKLKAPSRDEDGNLLMPPGPSIEMSWHYLGADGKVVKAKFPVPVNDAGEITHVEYECPDCPNSGRWVSAKAKTQPICVVHKAPLQKVDGKRRPRERSRAVAGEVFRMYGRSAAPWGLPAGALAVDAVATLAGMSPAEVAMVLPATAGAAVWAGTRRRLTREAVKNRRIEKGQKGGKRVRAIRRRAACAGLIAAETGVWASALAATDLTSTAGLVVAAAGAVRWAVGCWPWWSAAEQRRLRGITPDVNATIPDLPVMDEPDPIQLRAVTTWKTLIGCPAGPLAGTELVEFRRLPSCTVGSASRTRLPNWSAKVVPLVPGSINMREQRPALLGRIAAAYGCTYADVSFTADESDLGVGWLRVQPDNLLAEVQMWPGPDTANDWKRGRSRIGRFDDGEPIWYLWWTKTGAAHDLISGCSGSGKSELVAQLILDSLHSDGLVLDWVGDPQGGQSFGALKDEVDWFARDLTEIRLMLLAAVKEMLRRNDELSANNVKTWRATRAMPLLVVTLDEVQAYIEDPVVNELVHRLVGQGRKCGIKMRLITQIPAAYALGGSTYIKEQLKTGQSLIFRAMTDQAGRDATDGDCPINPTMLPTKWGKNTCAGGETTAGLLFVQGLPARDVYGRADWTGDDMLRWLVDADGRKTSTPGAFSAEAQAASGPLWRDRKERARRALAAGRSDVDLLPGGKAVELIQAASVTAPPPATPETVAQTAADAAQAKARDVVLAAARECADARGLVDRDSLANAVKGRMADGTFAAKLTELVASGDLRRVRNGLYEVPGATRAQQLPFGDAAC